MKQDYSFLAHRRAYERFIVESSASIITSDNLNIPSILRDVSVKGAGIICNYPLKINDEIDISIFGSFLEKSVYRKAKVVWCEQIDENLYQSGLDFGLDIIQFS